jgi:hypothetical protein
VQELYGKRVESHVGEFAGDDIGSEHHYDEMGRAVKPPARRR